MTEPSPVDRGKWDVAAGSEISKGHFMLKPASQSAKYCYDKAFEAEQEAANAQTQQTENSGCKEKSTD